MNILQIEDEVSWFEGTVKPLLIEIGAKEIFHADSYDSGIQYLQEHNIDYVVLDLAIPLNPENPVPDVRNGLRLASYIRTEYAGTPILILTGQQTEEAVEQFVEDQEPTTFWDGKRKSLVKVRPKRRVNEAISLLSDAVKELAAIDAIEIEEIGCELDYLEKRVIRIFCKENSAIAARVKTLNDGLSTAKVLQVSLFGSSGQELPWTSLVKIDTKQKIDQESNNFKEYVNKLDVASYPNILNEYVAGCADKKGICYRFANHYDSNYFSHLTSNEGNTLTILEKVRGILGTWSNNKTVKQVSVKEIRSIICPEYKFEKLAEIRQRLEIDEFEKKILNANYSIQHADLHGLNILVSEDLNPILIDYGDIKLAPSVLDIVTLELSPYFHPHLSGNKAPKMELFENWFNYENFLSLNQLPKVATFLREWKSADCFMEREYVATVYAYALRQLTHKGTNPDIATKLIEKSIAAYK
ncbi:MAG TPA: response regulator [Pseudoalteromonas sp.]|uniref:Response regulatory domain-containing protein n=1 Tax=marine sediment metagenome TaxID=412755 RepID=A0A0F9TBK0_9ZZZZ|nr:response regulator [Pseudoalteromonas sp.]HDZ35107.1 response regulator [Pseudoalteromonas sp.]